MQANVTSKTFTNISTVLAIFIVPLLILKLSSFPHAEALALLISVTILWFTEFIPLPATGLLIPVVAILYGIVEPSKAFAPFGNQILFLFIGSFLLAFAMQKHGMDKRMSYYILSKKFVRKSLSQIILSISFIAWLLSMWISNTAACAILTPICLALITTLKDQFPNSKKYKNFQLRILFSCAFSASIGGMATPIGSPPNLLALEFLSKNNIHLTFFDWMFVGVPISFIMLIALNLLLSIKYPLGRIDLSGMDNFFNDELKKLGSIKSVEIQVACCFTLAVFLWLLPGVSSIFDFGLGPLSLFIKRIPMGVVALLAAIILFILPANNSGQRNLDWDDAKKIDWGTVILFGGGLCLGAILGESGLASYLGNLIFSKEIASNLLYAAPIVILLGIILSEFGSNTASATILLPILLATFSYLPQEEFINLIVATAFATSFGFMLPVATPPNAIIYGSGKIPLKEMIKTGIYFDLLGFIVIYLFMFYVV